MRSALLLAYIHGPAEEQCVRCAWCGRVQLEDEWVPPSEYLLHGIPDAVDERLSHGICPACFEAEMAAAEAARRARTSERLRPG
jgi:hypothetical protein